MPFSVFPKRTKARPKGHLDPNQKWVSESPVVFGQINMPGRGKHLGGPLFFIETERLVLPSLPASKKDPYPEFLLPFRLCYLSTRQTIVKRRQNGSLGKLPRDPGGSSEISAIKSTPQRANPLPKIGQAGQIWNPHLMVGLVCWNFMSVHLSQTPRHHLSSLKHCKCIIFSLTTRFHGIRSQETSANSSFWRR